MGVCPYSRKSRRNPFCPKHCRHTSAPETGNFSGESYPADQAECTYTSGLLAGAQAAVQRETHDGRPLDLLRSHGAAPWSSPLRCPGGGCVNTGKAIISVKKMIDGQRGE